MSCRVLIVIALLWTGAGIAAARAADRPELADLAAQVGQPGSCALFEGGQPSEQLTLRGAMARDLGARPAKLILRGWGSGAPCGTLQRFGDILHVFVCKARNCSNFAADLFIDIAAGTVQACWTDRGRDHWLAPGAPPRSLPAGSSCAEANTLGAPGLLAKYGREDALTGQLAYSDKFAIQAFARGGANWCAEQVTLDFVIGTAAGSRNAGFFGSTEFEGLMRRLGSTVLEQRCPAARTATLRATDGRLDRTLWTGIASADTGWTPVASAADPASASAAPDAEPPAAATAAPLPTLPSDGAALPVLNNEPAPPADTPLQPLDAALKAIAAEPPTLEGATAATGTAEAAREAARDLPDGPARIDDALAAYRRAAAPVITGQEVASMQNLPATANGARMLIERRELMDRTVGQTTPGMDAFRNAVDARLAEIGRIVQPRLQATLTALPMTAGSRGKAREAASQLAASFGSSPAAADLRARGEAREKEIANGLADQEIAEIGQTPIGSVPELIRFNDRLSEEIRTLAADPAAADATGWLAAAGHWKLRSVAPSVLARYRAMAEGVEPSQANALHLALAATVLARRAASLPELGQFAEITRQAAMRARAGSCRTAAGSFGISGEQASLPVVVGEQTMTLGSFACALDAAGISRGTFDAPADAAGEYRLELSMPPRETSSPGDNETATARGPSLDAVFDFPPAAANPPGPIRAIVLRRVPVAPDAEALVGVETGETAKMDALSIDEWRRVSAEMVAPGNVPNPAQCGAANALSIESAARLLLECGGRT